MEIAFTAADEVRAAIERIGRTEDAHFSPGGGRLALAGLVRNRLLVLDVEADFEAGPPRVALTGAVEVRSAALRSPHGLAWVDETTLVVANRAGGIAIFEIPTGRPASARVRLEPVRRIGAGQTDLIQAPGSVSVSPIGLGLLELVVCDNILHQVSRHLLDRRDGYAVVASEMLLEDGLELPDGVAQSPSGRWIAISNHERHCVFLFRNAGRLDRTSKPDGILNSVHFPHGLRFAADGTALLVAEAGGPFVRLFRSDDRDWAGERRPDSSIRTMTEEVFRRGSGIPQEGGPKGIDVTRDGRLMATSCEAQPLAFFDMRALLGPTPALPAGLDDAGEEERVRATLLRYLASAHAAMPEPTEASRWVKEREIRMLLDSRSWRITAPLRRIAARLRERRRWRRR